MTAACSPKRQLRLGLCFLVGSSVIAWCLHLMAGFHFPFGWNDEKDFLFPAINLATNFSLQAPELGAFDGHRRDVAKAARERP